MRDQVERFEVEFAQWSGAVRSFAFWKGRVALYALCRALRLNAGDEVIVPGYTCVMDINPFLYLGGVPRYVDIDPSSYNVTPEAVEAAIGPRTRAIVAQHSYGVPCAMENLARLAADRGLYLIEDCCVALGSTVNGKMCGQFGCAAFWSFQWNKPFTTGLGGMLTVNDAELAGAVDDVRRREARAPAATTAAALTLQRWCYAGLVWPPTTAALTRLYRGLTHLGIVTGSSAPEEYRPEMPAGFFTGMSTSQARAGRRQLRRIAANVAHRRKRRELYDRLLPRAGFAPLTTASDVDPTLVTYPVRVRDKWAVLAKAGKHGVELGSWFESPLHPYETPLAAYGYQLGQCPHAERACREVVTLPTHRRISARAARRAVAFLQQETCAPTG